MDGLEDKWTRWIEGVLLNGLVTGEELIDWLVDRGWVDSEGGGGHKHNNPVVSALRLQTWSWVHIPSIVDEVETGGQSPLIRDPCSPSNSYGLCSSCGCVKVNV